MEVIWLTSSYPRYKGDTTSIFLKYLAENTANQGADLTIIAPDHHDIQQTSSRIKQNPFRYFIPRSLQSLAYGSGILPNLKQNRLLLLQVPFFLSAMLLKLILECKKNRPALIHAHWIFPIGTVAVLVGKLFNIPVIITAHGGDAFSLNSGIFKLIKSWTINNASLCTSNTKSTRSAITFNNNINKSKNIIIPMGVDYQAFNQGDPSSYIDLKSDHKVILFVGRLVEKKGVNYLIEAYKKLIDNKYTNISLWIAGDGEAREELESQVKAYALDSVKFFGRVQHDALPGLYAAADIFAAPSIVDSQGDTEGQGVVFLEALAAGLPVVTTNVGGITDVLEHNKHALICEEKNAQALASHIKRVLEDTDLNKKLIDNGLSLSKNHDWHTISKHFYDEYKALTS